MRVLFIEDDAMNRRVVRDMLSVAGADVAEAPDGVTGLRMIDEEDFNLILMDLRMPGMDGLTAIRHIRARDDHKSTLPILVVTADTGFTIRQDCLDSGADGVLLKPVAMKALFDAMGKTIVSRSKEAALL